MIVPVYRYRVMDSEYKEPSFVTAHDIEEAQEIYIGAREVSNQIHGNLSIVRINHE